MRGNEVRRGMRGRCEDYEELESGLEATVDFHAAVGEMQMKVEREERGEQQAGRTGGKGSDREGSQE